MMGAIKFRCLNLWYAKSFQANIMKLAAFTKLNLKVLYITKQLKHLTNML